MKIEEKRDAQEDREDAQFIQVPHEQTGVQWHNIKSSNPSDDEPLPQDTGRLGLT